MTINFSNTRLSIALLFGISISLQAAPISATPELDACNHAVELLERQIDTLDIACKHDGDCGYVFHGRGTRENPITLVNEGVPKKEALNLLKMQSKVTQACRGVSSSRQSNSNLFPAICRAGRCIKDSGIAEVPSKEKTDIRRTPYARFVCDDVSGTKLMLKISGEGSCADLRPGPVGIQISNTHLSDIGRAIPLEIGWWATRAWRCDSKQDCIPVKGSVTLSAFHEGGIVSGRYYLRFPDGAETGFFENVHWCPPDKQSRCKSF